MPYLSDDIIEEVRSRNDIVDVIGSYVKLTKKGSSYFGLCPFHNEKSPSFSVSGGKQMFYCFGCGKGGNVFSFLKEYENMTFQEAVKYLADRAGVALPEVEMTGEERRQNDLKTTILEINTEAARYYHKLLGTKAGDMAKEYFKKRELLPETITAFGLGVSSMKSDDLYRYMKQKGYADQVLKETGLFVYDEQNGVHDRFRNRVMYPIMNMNRKVIGFGGRVMGDAKPKYLNSPETPVFDKGRNLYGLHIAKASRKNNFIICEGYMDVISMHQAGFSQAVASLGTALTTGQVMLMKRYVKDILVCYDSDGAGVHAALKAIGMFKDAGMNTKVINMRPYKDADEFLKAEGPEAFQKRIDEAENSFLYEIRMMESQFDLADPTGRTNFFNAVAKRLLEFSEEIERTSYRDAIAAKYEVSAQGLQQLITKFASEGVAKVATPRSNTSPVKKETDDALKKTQRMILTWIADDQNIYHKIKAYLKPEDFTDPVYQKVAQLIFESVETGNFNPGSIIGQFEDDAVHAEVAKILNTELVSEQADLRERERALNEAVLALKRYSLEEKTRTTSDLAVLQQVFKEQANLKNIHITLT